MNRIASSRALLVFIPLTLAAFGCKGNSIDGKWKLTGETMPGTGDVVMTFHGGALTVDTKLTLPQLGTISVNGTGTYKVEGENLTTTIADVKIDTSAATPMAKSVLESPQAKAQMITQFNQSPNAKMKFDSADQILLTSNGKTQTLTRVR